MGCISSDPFGNSARFILSRVKKLEIFVLVRVAGNEQCGNEQVQVLT